MRAFILGATDVAHEPIGVLQLAAVALLILAVLLGTLAVLYQRATRPGAKSTQHTASNDPKR